MKKNVLALCGAALLTVSSIAAAVGEAQNMPTSQNPALDPTIKSFVGELAAQGGKPLYDLSYADARKVLTDLQAKPVDKPDVDTEDLVLKLDNIGDIKVRITRPKGHTGELPVLFYVHGGGWVLGDENTHDRLLRDFTVGANIAVASIIYTPSPEAQFPVPLNQIYAAIEEMTNNAQKYKFANQKFAIAGDSVGGNMATAITMMAKEKQGPKIGLQVLLYPVTNANFNSQSYNSFADGPWLTKKSMEWFWNAYAPNESDRSNVLASPLQATTEQLKGLPEAFIITDQNDVLRDEAEAYAEKLMQAGVKVTAVRYNGAMHDFMMLNPIANSAPTKAAIAQTNSVLKSYYGS